MHILRTPNERFENLSGYAFARHYADLKAGDGTPLRMHYVDEGPRDGEIILCLHGQPSWSYLYRKMIPILAGAGFRVIAPDLIGFGRSDKPALATDYTYSAHVDWMAQFIKALSLNAITLVCQDWGGLIGLRVVGEQSERFARLVIANTSLPDTRMVSPELSTMLATLYPQIPIPDASTVAAQFQSGGQAAFLYWIKYAAEAEDFSIEDVFAILSQTTERAVLNGYSAPFPDERYMAGARRFPSLVPIMPEHRAELEANDRAWAVLEAFEKPVLTAFSDGDPVTRGIDAVFQARIPGAKGERHVTIEGAGHFLQEDAPQPFSAAIIGFIRSTAKT